MFQTATSTYLLQSQIVQPCQACCRQLKSMPQERPKSLGVGLINQPSWLKARLPHDTTRLFGSLTRIESFPRPLYFLTPRCADNAGR